VIRTGFNKYLFRLCLLSFTLILSNDERSTILLKAPDLSSNNIIGCNVGVRPYRKSGVRIEAEFFNKTLVIHNYGYGGSGLTLCWGGAQEAIALMEREKQKNIYAQKERTVAVLGAGVIGLATAYDLLEKGYDVTIYAHEFSPHLTSNVAAGIWSPPAMRDTDSEERKAFVSGIVDVSKQRFLKSAATNQPEFEGIRFIDDYHFKVVDQTAETVEIERSLGFAHSDPGEQVTVCFDNGTIKQAKKERSLCLDGKIFIEDLFAKVQSKGAKLIEKKFHTPDDVKALSESVVINCTSLGSRELFNDQEFVPVRGQLLYFRPQVDVNYMVHQNVPGKTNYWVSVYPWQDRLIVGGLFETGCEDLVNDPIVIESLLIHARECFQPSVGYRVLEPETNIVTEEDGTFPPSS
jgi:D-amino-acid oxidase